MAGEQDLLNRWSLRAENPKALDALNLQIERAKLAPDYRPGRSAPELELKARQADLAARQRRYIDDQNAQHAKELATGDPVTTRLSPEVDFSTHSPYTAFEPDSDTVRHGRRRSPSQSVEPGDAKPSKAEVGKRFDAFQKEVASLQGDQMSARSAGQATYKRKAREMAEQKARMALANPPNTYGLHVDVPKPALSGAMELGGMTVPVPHGGHFDTEQVFGPSVATAPARSFEPEQPVGDGDLPNDYVNGAPETDQDYREPPAFTDLRKPAGAVMAPSTRPVAHREY